MKHTVAGALAIALTASSLLTLSTGVAAADPDVIGKTYGEAKGLLSQSKMTATVAAVVGDRMPLDQCYVVSASKVTSRNSSGKATYWPVVNVNLSCYAAPADGKSPGYSEANLGKDAIAVRDAHDAATKKWLASPDGQKFCTKREAEHPEWALIPGCDPEEE